MSAKSDLDRLTTQGQQYYADQRQDGVTHERAMEQALYSYGPQRGERANLRRRGRGNIRRGGWVAPLSGDQFAGLSSAVGPGSVMTGTDGGYGGGDGGGDGGGL